MYHASNRRLASSGVCLLMFPQLAKEVGKAEAIFLQQLHYWLTTDHEIGHISNGQKWIYNSYKSWVENIKIFSESTVRRAVRKLEERGLILTQNMNKKKSDHTKWYTINYEILQDLIPGIFDRKEKRVGASKADERLFKMNSPCVQNEQIINKETEITSEKFLSTEGRGGNRGKSVETQQVHGVEKEDKLINKNLEPKNNLASTLLEIWNQTVRQGQGEGDSLVKLTKERAQYLVAAFKYRFDSCLVKWKQFCHLVTTSEFLMGKAKSVFKASLDWVLKFNTIQRILEGDFGVKTDLVSSEGQSLQKDEETLGREIEDSADSQGVKAFRLSVLRIVGGQVYQSWFSEVNISITEEGRGVALTAKTRFISDYIQTHYLDKLQSLVNHRINISSETG